MCTKFRVDSSSRFPFRARTNYTQTDTQSQTPLITPSQGRSSTSCSDYFLTQVLSRAQHCSGTAAVGPLQKNMESSTKPEVHNAPQRHRAAAIGSMWGRSGKVRTCGSWDRHMHAADNTETCLSQSIESGLYDVPRLRTKFGERAFSILWSVHVELSPR